MADAEKAKETKKIARMTLKDKLAAAERQIAELTRTNEEQRAELEKLKAKADEVLNEEPFRLNAAARENQQDQATIDVLQSDTSQIVQRRTSGRTTRGRGKKTD